MSTFSTSSRQKRLKTRSFFYTFDFEMCFAPHRRALFWHFFDIWTSKSGPRPSVFNTFDLEICFTPQRRALFQHLNFQKWSEAEVFCTFWLGNVLRATTACTFSTSQLPKVVFIAPVASWVRTRRFSEPTFRPSGATNHWKNTVFRDFPTFSRICIFCPLTLSLLIFSLLIFPLLSASTLLCFSSVHIVGSLTSKLPSNIYIYIKMGWLYGPAPPGNSIYNAWSKQ